MVHVMCGYRQPSVSFLKNGYKRGKDVESVLSGRPSEQLVSCNRTDHQ